MKCVCFDNFPCDDVESEMPPGARQQERVPIPWQAIKRPLIYCPRKTIRHGPFHIRCERDGVRAKRDGVARTLLLTGVFLGSLIPLLPLDTLHYTSLCNRLPRGTGCTATAIYEMYTCIRRKA